MFFSFIFFSRRNGALTLALARELKDCLSLRKSVKKLKFKPQHVEIHLENDQTVVANRVISTLPTFVLGPLLKDYPSLASKLAELPYTTLIILNIGFHNSILPFKGFGYLVPSKWKLPILGCVWDSCIFPQQNKGNQTRLTVMMGGHHYPEIEQISDAELINKALQFLQKHLYINAKPQVIQIKKAYRAIPQFQVGHELWKKNIQEECQACLPRLTLSGSAWSGVSINDCVAYARQLGRGIDPF